MASEGRLTLEPRHAILSSDRHDVASALAEIDCDLRLSAGNTQCGLHDDRDRIAEQRNPNICAKMKTVSERHGGAKVEFARHENNVGSSDLTINADTLSGDRVQIIFRARNNAALDKLYWDNVSVFHQ